MGTITGTLLLDRIKVLLQDPDATRYPRAELLVWLNDGQREIAAIRPDASAKRATISLHAGTRQTVPNESSGLIDLVRNILTSPCRGSRAIRRVSMALLDSQAPDWHTRTSSSTVKEYVLDPRTPKTFYVYPPATEGVLVEAVYAVPPTPLSSEGTAISVDDIYANALVDYILFRAYAKETEDSLMQRAAAYRASFENALGLKTSGDAATAVRVA